MPMTDFGRQHLPVNRMHHLKTSIYEMAVVFSDKIAAMLDHLVPVRSPTATHQTPDLLENVPSINSLTAQLTCIHAAAACTTLPTPALHSTTASLGDFIFR